MRFYTFKELKTVFGIPYSVRTCTALSVLESSLNQNGLVSIGWSGKVRI